MLETLCTNTVIFCLLWNAPATIIYQTNHFPLCRRIPQLSSQCSGYLCWIKQTLSWHANIRYVYKHANQLLQRRTALSTEAIHYEGWCTSAMTFNTQVKQCWLIQPNTAAYILQLEEWSLSMPKDCWLNENLRWNYYQFEKCSTHDDTFPYWDENEGSP